MFAYGATAVVGICWICDVNKIMGKIPFYKENLLYPYEDDKRIYIKPRQNL